VVQNLLKNELEGSALADGKLELKQAALAKFLKKKQILIALAQKMAEAKRMLDI
jgi:hypothetical protein